MMKLLMRLIYFQPQFDFHEYVLRWSPQLLPPHSMCGAAAISFLRHVVVGSPLPASVHELSQWHSNMKAGFVQALFEDRCCRCPTAWETGSTAGLAKTLSEELAKHGVPEALLEQRAQQAIRAIGPEPIQNALKAKNVWRSLKTIGSSVRFQFILPEELATLVDLNRSALVGKKPRNVAITPKRSIPTVLDPTKLSVLDGTQPLSIAVLAEPEANISTALPHRKTMIPCICIANQEPLLVEAVVVQLGAGLLEKHVADSAIALDPLEMVTLKIMTYRDEHQGNWNDFVSAPIKQLVLEFPMLRRCHDASCACACWHNPDGQPSKEPIMDVWKRQFLTSNFRPTPAAKSDIFSVCLRLPAALLPDMLSRSGQFGSYMEPRTPDGQEVLDSYVVIWALTCLQVSWPICAKQTQPSLAWADWVTVEVSE